MCIFLQGIPYLYSFQSLRMCTYWASKLAGWHSWNFSKYPRCCKFYLDKTLGTASIKGLVLSRLLTGDKLPLFSPFLWFGVSHSVCIIDYYLHCGGNSKVCIALYYIANGKRIQKRNAAKRERDYICLPQPRAGCSHAWRSAQLVLLLRPAPSVHWTVRKHWAVGTIPIFSYHADINKPPGWGQKMVWNFALFLENCTTDKIMCGGF